MNHTFIVALIQNAGLLLAMVVVFDFLASRQKLFATPSRQALAGLAIGSIGIAMIEVSVPLEAGIIFDTRSVLLAVSGLFLGAWPTVIAMVMTAAFRLSLGGEAGWTGVAVILASGAIGIVWRRLLRRPLEDVSWRDLYALGLVVHLVMLALMFTLPWEIALRVVRAVGVPVMVVHPLATVALGALVVQRLRYRQTTAEISKSEARFRLLAENARDLIFRYELTPKRGFAYVSPSATSLTGYTPEEHYADPDLLLKLVHPDDRPLLGAAARGGLPPDQPVVLRWIRKDGEIFWGEGRSTYIFDEHGNLTAVEGIARDVTASRQAEERLRLALKAAKQGLYDLNVQTGEATVSEEYVRMLGYDPVGFCATHDAWIERLHPDDREAGAAAYRDYIAGRLPEYRVECRERTRTGEWLWILSLGSIVSWDAEGKPLRMLGTRTDVTSLKMAEQQTRDAQAETAGLLAEAEQSRRALLSLVEDAVGAARGLEGANRTLELQIAETRKSDEAHRRLATVVEQAAETIVVTDLDGTIVYVNPAFESTTGYTRDEAIGQNPRMLNSGKQPAEFYQQLWSTIRAGRVWQGHFVNRRKDGSLYEEEAVVSPVRDASGTTINYAAIKRDVTAEIALAEQLRHAQKIEAIGTLAGGVAHDFNNLLQAMLSIVQLLERKGAESPRAVQHLSQLEKTIRRGSDLTRQLLLFARREVSRRTTLDLNQILRDLMEFLHRVVRADIHLSVEPANVPLRISADRGQIEQVIMNLAMNAIDAMPEGGTLSVGTGGDENTAWLEVSDTGTGIPEAIRDRIFEPFFTTKEAGKGTGLGLSVVHGIIAVHGGRIDVECPAEGGTIIRVELPLQGPAAVPEPVAPSEEDVPTGRGERVLLVEDDQAAREGLSGILEMLGYAVVAVGAGEEAVGIDERVPFAIVLTDSMLPGMPGIEVVRRLRERRPAMKAILMSGYAAPGVIEAAGAVSPLRFLQKPFDMADLARTLRDVLHPQPPDVPERP